MKTLALMVLGLSLLGCGSDTVTRVKCTANAQCVSSSDPSGICEPTTSFCAFHDNSCPSGFRYYTTGSDVGACVAGGDMAVTTQDMATGEDLHQSQDMPTTHNDLAVPIDMKPRTFDLAVFDMASVPPSLTWTAKTDGSSAINYNSVYGSASNDVYVVGSSGTNNVVHYVTGQPTNTGSLNGVHDLKSVFSNSSGTTWAVGGAGTILEVTNGGSTSLAETSGSTYDLQGLFGFGQTLYAAASNSGKILSRASNSVWTAHSTDPTSVYYEWLSIWGSSASDLYAVGLDITTSTNQPIISHSTDGSSWSLQTVPSGLSGVRLFSTWGSSASDVYAVGDKGTILHSTGGGSWAAQSSGTTALLAGVFGSGAGDVYAVGNNGTILHSAGNGVWFPENSGTTQNLASVWAAAQGDVWAVGANGTILHGAP